jgi:hypothetical protein
MDNAEISTNDLETRGDHDTPNRLLDGALDVSVDFTSEDGFRTHAKKKAAKKQTQTAQKSAWGGSDNGENKDGNADGENGGGGDGDNGGRDAGGDNGGGDPPGDGGDGGDDDDGWGTFSSGKKDKKKKKKVSLHGLHSARDCVLILTGR